MTSQLDETVDTRIEALEQRLGTVESDLQTAITRDIPLLKGTVRSLLHDDVDSIDAFPAAGRAFGERVVDHGERIDQLEARLEVLGQHTEASTKAQKIAAVLAFAHNKADGSEKVAVTPAEIRGCTGVSRRYAYDLLEAIAADLEGVQVRDARQVQTGSGTKHKSKALLIDCEVVHELETAVNSFTIPNGGDDGE